MPSGFPAETRFAVFRAPEWGIRALARVLASYQRQGIDTIRKAINRYAPPTDNNDTESYVKSVAAHTGIYPDEPIDFTAYKQVKGIVEAIINHENGQQPYSDDLITKGLELAGVTGIPARFPFA